MSRTFQINIGESTYQIKQSQMISFLDLDIINSRYGTSFSTDALIGKLNKKNGSNGPLYGLQTKKDAAIFKQFHVHQLNFTAISERLGIDKKLIRKDIIRSLVNNISKLCILVRRRGISMKSQNIITFNNARKLVVRILRPNDLLKVKDEYPSLWKFISKTYQESFYIIANNQYYMLIYKELILLAKAYKVNGPIDSSVDFNFENGIIQPESQQGEIFFRQMMHHRFARNQNSDRDSQPDVNQQRQKVENVDEKQVSTVSKMKQSARIAVIEQQLLVCRGQLIRLKNLDDEGVQCLISAIVKTEMKIIYIEDYLDLLKK